MANIANNEVMIYFIDNASIEKKQEVIKALYENIVYEDIYNEPDLENDNWLELSYGTKWIEQYDELVKLANKHRLRIIGVCYEWGCSYVNHFDITAESYFKDN